MGHTSTERRARPGVLRSGLFVWAGLISGLGTPAGAEEHPHPRQAGSAAAFASPLPEEPVAPGVVLREEAPLPGEHRPGWEALDGVPEAGGRDAEALVAQALRDHPRVLAATAARQEAEARARAAWDAPDPHLSWEGSGEIEVELPLSAALRAPVAGWAARPEVQAARLAEAEARARLELDVRRAVLSVQAAEARYALALRRVDVFTASRDAAVAQVEAGNAVDRAWHLRELALAQARLDAAGAEQAVITARAALDALVGGPAGALAPLPPLPEEDAAPTATLAELEASALAASFAVQRRALGAEAARREAVVARTRALVPQVGLVFSAHPASGERTFGAAVEIPLFGAGVGAIAAPLAEADRLDAEVADLRRGVVAGVRAAHATLALSEARAAFAADVRVPAGAALQGSTLLQFNAMQLGLDPLLLSLLSVLDADGAELDARVAAHAARLDVDAWLAGIAPGAPSPVPETRSAATGGEGAH